MTDPSTKIYDVAILFGQPVLFSFERVDPADHPETFHLYEMRHDSHDPSAPLWLENKVDSDYYGTIIAKDSIELNAQYVRNYQTGDQTKMRTVDDDDFRIDDFAMTSIDSYLKGNFELSSRSGESHPEPLSEPYVTVSRHTALVIFIAGCRLTSSGRISPAENFEFCKAILLPL